ncbi:MAG: hypothetical protein HUJ52_00350 [Malacoplasma sp.]|nr:hypothetical protein [Malacoplasma sp.]
MKYSKKIKLLSSLSILTITTTLTSCAAVTISRSDGVIGQIDIETINWIWRSLYNYKDESTIESEIVNRVKADNITIFNRYPGLENAVNFETNLNNGDITITVTATGDTYTGTKSWDATYAEYPKPGPSPSSNTELQINVSSIVPYFITGDDATQYTVTVTKPNGDSVELVDANCTVESNNSCLSAVKNGAVSSNSMTIDFTPDATITGVAIVVINVVDSENNMGSKIVTILVKDPAGTPKTYYLHNVLIKYETESEYNNTFTKYYLTCPLVTSSNTEWTFKTLNEWAKDQEYTVANNKYLTAAGYYSKRYSDGECYYGVLDGLAYYSSSIFYTRKIHTSNIDGSKYVGYEKFDTYFSAMKFTDNVYTINY